MSKNIEKWIVAQKKQKLSDKHVAMARELGLNPEKFTEWLKIAIHFSRL